MRLNVSAYLRKKTCRGIAPRRFSFSSAVFVVAIVTLVIGLLPSSGAIAGDKGSPSSRVARPTGSPRQAIMNINNVSMWANDNGILERRLSDSAAGVVYPKGSTSVVYTGGFVWGGRVFDNSFPLVRVGGQTFASGTRPGRIIRPGVAENPFNADVRIYRIRRDWGSADLTKDASDVYSIAPAFVNPSHIQSLKDQYKRDWLEWPWEKGAPYYERNGIPGYQPNPWAVVDSLSDEPGLANADQVIWFVTNDLDPDATYGLYGSPPIGLEEQVTCWAFAHQEGLQDVIYQRYRMIYKGTETTPSTATIDQMYLAKWVDPDIGNFSDDFAGSDSTRGLAYVYNSTESDAEFQKLNMVPPVVGYDMVQGPRSQRTGETARWNLQMVPGYENLPVTTIAYFTEATRTFDRQLGSYGSAQQWWNLLRGLKPGAGGPSSCLTDYLSGECTGFELSGDPQSYRGWVDGRKDAAGDRRIMLSSGPFTMALGDTQEVVIALIGAIGSSNRDGVTVLKERDGTAQDAMNLNFDFPAAIPETPLRIVELDKKFIFDWESDTTRAKLVESYDSRGYTFEGYSLYQLPYQNSTLADAVQLPSFDITKPRFLPITRDYIRNRELVNGTKYYYAISAVVTTYDRSFAKNRIEAPLIVRTAIPHSPNPGTMYPYVEEDVISNVEDAVGQNDAKVRIQYFNPSSPDGHTYKFVFRRSTNPLTDIETRARWDLVDATTQDTLLKSIRMDTIPRRVITRGFTAEARSPLHGIRGVYEIAHDNIPVHENVFNQPNSSKDLMIVADSVDIGSLQGGNALDADIEIRFQGDSSWSLMYGVNPAASRMIRVPFTAWQVGILGKDTVHRQVYTVITANGGDSIWRPSVLLDRSYEGRTLQVFYPLTVVSDSQRIDVGTSIAGRYDDSIVYRSAVELGRVKAFLWINGRTNQNYKNAVWKAYFADIDGDGLPAPAGSVVKFQRYRVVRNGDEKAFIPTSVVTQDFEAAKLEVKKVNVFPNPYYGVNTRELDRFNRFITFNHLPAHATIRIFTLSGDLIKVVVKDSPDQFATWDLNNHNGLPVGSGIYLAHIEMKDAAGADLGTTILKLMIVREKTFLEGN